MEPFTCTSGVAAALPQANLDTDQIMPKQFLKGIGREGLSTGFLFGLRFADIGVERPEFVLNREPWRKATILLTGPNFGCGSSREHAVWGLRELGIRCVIGTTFGGIFGDNCARNGVPAISVDSVDLDHLMSLASNPATSVMTVSLVAQTVETADGRVVSFGMDPLRRHMLLNGLDAVGLTLQHIDDISRFEKEYFEHRPWLA